MHSLMLLGELAIRALLLGGAGIFTVRAIRPPSAETQHAIWRIVLAGMLGLPVLMSILPAQPILPAIPAVAFSAKQPVAFRPTITVTPNPVAILPRSTIRRAVGVRQADLQASSRFDFSYLLLIIYGMIAVVLVSRTTLGVYRASAAAAAARQVVCSAVDEMVYPRPEVRESANAVVPFTVGLRNPVIVLPKDWRDWDSFKLRSVLAHELAHIRRFDWMTAIAAAANRALFWFNPLSWWLERRLAALAEEACDSTAIQSTGDARKYASVVLEFARVAAAQPFPVAPSMARVSRIGVRLNRILETRVQARPEITRLAGALMLAATLPAVYAAATLHFVPESKSQQFDNAAYWQGVGTAKRTSKSQQLMADGWHTTPQQALQLESQLAADPENLALRYQLLSYYTQYILPEPRTTHLLWLIEHHPEADIFQFGFTVVDALPELGLTTPADADRVRQLWLRQAERFRTNTKVLAHAAAALSVSEPIVAVNLVRQARALQPENLEWVDWMGAIYERAVRTSFAGGRVHSGASPSKNDIAWPIFNPPLSDSEALKRELETSVDADLVGRAGEDLVHETTLLISFRNHDQPTSNGRTEIRADQDELTLSAAFGRQLLSRAHQLDPGNPRWQ